MHSQKTVNWKIPLHTLKRVGKSITEMDLQEIGGVDSSGSGGVWWQAVLSAAMKTSYCVKGREFSIASVELFFSFTEFRVFRFCGAGSHYLHNSTLFESVSNIRSLKVLLK